MNMKAMKDYKRVVDSLNNEVMDIMIRLGMRVSSEGRDNHTKDREYKRYGRALMKVYRKHKRSIAVLHHVLAKHAVDDEWGSGGDIERVTTLVDVLLRDLGDFSLTLLRPSNPYPSVSQKRAVFNAQVVHKRFSEIRRLLLDI